MSFRDQLDYSQRAARPRTPGPARTPMWDRAAETMARSSLEKLQLARLKATLELAYRKVPFYRRAFGQRTDKLGGRPVVTVYYQLHGKRVAYSIVGGSALPEPRAGAVRLGGVETRTFDSRGRTVVTWRRSGHTCVLSGEGVSAAALRQLAEWRSSQVSG